MKRAVSWANGMSIIFICFFLNTVRATSSARSRREQNTRNDYERPNIILLLTDDQDALLGGFDQMPILGEKLIKDGTLFNNAFVHTPMCCPSRSSILTGRYLHNGVALNNGIEGNCYGERWVTEAEKETFAVHAKKAGYVTSYAGKYLNQYGHPNSPGCVSGISNDTAKIDEGCLRIPPGYDKWLGWTGFGFYYDYNVVQSDDGGETATPIYHGNDYYNDYLPDLVANRTLDMIEEFTTNNEEPFLIVNAWPTPHGPYTPAPWAENLHNGAKAHRTPNYNASSEFMQQKHWLLRNLVPLSEQTGNLIDEKYEHRLEALHSVDEHVGQIVDLLIEKDILDKTIILFTSDNGYQLGQHRLPWGKAHLYEHDIRVPFVMRGPGIPKGVITDRMVANVDIAPSFYHFMNGPSSFENTPPSMDGISVVPYLQNLGSQDIPTVDDPYIRKDILIEYNGQGDPTCGLRRCPPPPRFLGVDSINNTYSCIRSIQYNEERGDGTVEDDYIYCRFDYELSHDGQDFGEFYDHIEDPMQLYNKFDDLTPEQKRPLEGRLMELRSCQGESCRTLPSSTEV